MLEKALKSPKEDIVAKTKQVNNWPRKLCETEGAVPFGNYQTYRYHIGWTFMIRFQIIVSETILSSSKILKRYWYNVEGQTSSVSTGRHCLFRDMFRNTVKFSVWPTINQKIKYLGRYSMLRCSYMSFYRWSDRYDLPYVDCLKRNLYK